MSVDGAQLRRTESLKTDAASPLGAEGMALDALLLRYRSTLSPPTRRSRSPSLSKSPQFTRALLTGGRLFGTSSKPAPVFLYKRGTLSLCRFEPVKRRSRRPSA